MRSSIGSLTAPGAATASRLESLHALTFLPDSVTTAPHWFCGQIAHFVACGFGTSSSGVMPSFDEQSGASSEPSTYLVAYHTLL